MKNLHLYTASTTASPGKSGTSKDAVDLTGVVSFCIDAANALTYFAEPDKIVCVDKNMKQQKTIEWNVAEFGKLVLFDFLVDDMEICAVFENGTLLLISAYDGTIREEPVLFDQIVSGGAWSPDLGLLVIATADKLFSITRNFEVEQDVELYIQDPGKEQLMTIGWGARETQFQGIAGRQKREKVDENTIPGPMRPLDDKRVLISWRSDAQYFTVSTVEERLVPGPVEDQKKVECRHLRVWNRDLELMSQCEELAGMEDSLAMRPVGNLMAVTRVLNAKRDLWLYERNGQWRSHFEVGVADLEVVSIGWNCDATVLLIHLRKEAIDLLQFWMVSNYDWVMKVELERDALKVARWDPESPHKLHFISCSGRYDLVEFEPVYDSLNSTVLSVAGGSIRVSDLIVSPIPPPMFHYQLNVGKTGVHLLSQSVYGLALLLSDGRLASFKGKKHEPLAIVKLNRSSSGICFNLNWADPDHVSVIADNQVFLYNISSGEEKLVYSQDTPIIYQKYLPSLSTWYIQHADGKWIKITSDQVEQLSLDFASNNVHRCEIIQFNNHIIFFGINRNNQLIINGHVAHQAIGSWAFDRNGFLVTSLNNQLFGMLFIDLVEILKNPPKMLPKNAAYGWFNEGAGRAVERGAVVVGVEEEGVRVFLQMPRGNLETIEPRFRIIPWLKELISTHEYGKAIRLMRRQRVDMNLLFDHDYQSFVKNVDKFIDQVDDAELLNLFVFGLNNSDSTRGTFLPYYLDRKDSPDPVEKKVQIVSELILQAILKIEDTTRRHKLYTSALSCFLAREPKIVHEAFLNMKSQILSAGLPLEQTNEQFIQQKPSLFRRWTKHLNYFVKDLELFRGALLTYDLVLAYEVAECINMDPREFLPLLDSFKQKSPEAYQRFHIDLHVENYVSALINIAMVEDKIDECVEHIKKHNLYSKALQVFQKSNNYSKIAKLCAENALANRRFDEAGMLFEKAGDYQDALKAYELSLNLPRFLYSAKKVPLDAEAMKRNLTVFALKLEQQSKFVIAAETYKKIGVESNLSKIIENYTKAQEWTHASNELQENDENEFYGDAKLKLIKEASSRVSFILEDLVKTSENVIKLNARLEIVRNNKEKQVEEWLENEGEVDVAQSETMSEMSSASGMSNISRLSKMSVAQAKRRQNVERKKKTVKEGSQYEDIGILTSMSEAVKKLNEIQKECEQLLPTLVFLDLLNDARCLQRECEKTVKVMSDKRVYIWPRFIKAKHLTGPMVEIYRCEDGLVRIPGEDHMPSRIYIENEMVPPKLDVSYSWKLKCLE